MPATELLCHLLGVNPCKLTSQENLILEVDLFTRICEELLEVYKAKNQDYFSLMRISVDKESVMFEAKFLRFVIKDILMTEEYSLAGIAYYTQIPEDVICDIAQGTNNTPSLRASRKIIELHRSVRPDIYKEVVKKIASEYLAVI